MTAYAEGGTSAGRSEGRGSNRGTLRGGVLHGGAMIVLAVLSIALLLNAPSARPPSIAEIAPAAVEQIKEAPLNQASQSGRGDDGQGGGGDGDGDGDGAAPTTTTTAAPSVGDGPEVPRRTACVGNPGRQTEDPQSPPCAPYWDPDADNGGSTADGVTRSEVQIVLPNFHYQPLIDYFNRRFEFYGRKLVVVGRNDYLGCAPNDQQAAAEELDRLHNPFASAFYHVCYGATFNREMARRGVVTVTSEPVYSEAQLAEWAPYLWQYPMSTDRVAANIGEWVCQNLADYNAARAGLRNATDMRAEKRKFAILAQRESGDENLDRGPLRRELKACGAEVVWDKEVDPAAGEVTPTVQMKDAGATSVICLCGSAQLQNFARAATTQRFEPEWLVSTYLFNDLNHILADVPKDQSDQVIGLTAKPRQVARDKTPSFWATSEIVGSDRYPFSDTGGTRYILDNVYRSLLLLASGVQLAGPHLTPSSFAAGLQRAVFPNPDHEIRPGKVGFFGGSHSMTVDLAAYWWDNQARSPWEGDPPGAICYVDGGRRFGAGTWERRDMYASPGPCDSGG